MSVGLYSFADVESRAEALMQVVDTPQRQAGIIGYPSVGSDDDSDEQRAESHQKRLDDA
jgi:hypothetical protein